MSSHHCEVLGHGFFVEMMGCQELADGPIRFHAIDKVAGVTRCMHCQPALQIGIDSNHSQLLVLRQPSNDARWSAGFVQNSGLVTKRQVTMLLLVVACGCSSDACKEARHIRCLLGLSLLSWLWFCRNRWSDDCVGNRWEGSTLIEGLVEDIGVR